MSKITFADELGIKTFEQLKDHLSTREYWQCFFGNEKFTQILKEAESLFERMTGGTGGILSRHPYFTIHGVSHSRNIIIVLYTMMGELNKNFLEDKQRLTGLEIFCLLLSAYFHDVGMFFELDEEEKKSLSLRQQEDRNYTEESYIRQNHHERSYNVIMKHTSLVKLLDSFNSDLKELVAIVSKGHRKNIDTEEYKAWILEGTKIRTRFLASLLGLADALDLSPERAEKEFYEIHKSTMSELNKAHFLTYINVIKSVALEGSKARSGLTQLDIDIKLNVSSGNSEIQRIQNDYFTKSIVDSLSEEVSRTKCALQEELIELSLKADKSPTSFLEDNSKEMKRVFIASLGDQRTPRYTLDMLPDQISREKWVVMVGNRRKPPDAWAWEDFFVDSSDTQDLYWIFELGLPKDTIILGDSKEEFNEHLFREEKRNLLIIGSPGVNRVSKKANFGSFFRFFSQRTTLENENRFKEQYPFKRMREEYPQIQDNVERLIASWKGASFIGPLENLSVPSKLSEEKTTGIVSLCIHPYCEDRMAILAAGSRYLGTICAIKMLADSQQLQKYPLGGIVKLTIRNDKRGFDVHYSSCDWYSNEYRIEDALEWFRERLIRVDFQKYGYTEEEILTLIRWLYP